MLMAACSTTSHLPQDEVLYAGIKELAYDRKPKVRTAADTTQTGVITALADAYSTVEGLLRGDASVLKSDEAMTHMQKDSLRQRRAQDSKAYDEARTEVEAVIAMPPNGAIMGSSYTRWPWPLRLAIYNRYVESRSRFGRWMLNTFGASPKTLSTVSPSVRTQVARNTLRNYGYFRGWTAFDTVPTRRPRQAKLRYEVHTGPLFHLDTVRYQLFPARADSLIRASARQSLLAAGAPFSVKNLDGERTRVATLLRNNGYFFYQPDYVTFRADTLQRPLHVQLQVRPKPGLPSRTARQFYMGRTYITLFKHDRWEIVDSMERRDTRMCWSGDDRPPLRMGAIRRFLFYQPGDMYRHDLLELGREKMGAQGIFSQLKVQYVPRDTTLGCDTLDTYVTAVLDKPYDAEFEGRVTTKSNGQVGPGAVFSMAKRNALRGAETLGMRVWGSYEWQTGANQHGDRQLINSYEYGGSLSLAYPRIMLFGLARQLNRRSIATTNFQLDARWMNRAGYFGRVSFGGRMTYTLQRRRWAKHELTPFRLDYDQMLHTTARFDSIVGANQALYVSMRDQFVPSMEYNYHWTSHRHAPRTLMVNVKEAGNITSALYAAAGRPFTRRDKRLFGVPFAQYLKASAQYTHLFELTRRSGIATRIFAGAVLSYGNSGMAPYADLFSVGGANSIRAFAVRSIGPGSYHPAQSNYSYIDEMGDIKVEANVEYRFPLIANLYGAVFIDAGNVWLRREDKDLPGGCFSFSRLGDQIALGTGAGLRYDLDFLVVRFDVGVGLHAPYQTSRARYYNMERFGRSLGYHLAIGYPF
ncbi:MAG: BamA/TamA family outer membrane protein [Bacteroidaceae bacterium]|nr:BamA/TamA family outer membrane protein [Bacteroidaceae bacterium]